MYTILIADDEQWIRKGLAKTLGNMGIDINIIEAADGRDASAAIHERQPDLALMDVCMPYASGLDIMDEASNSGSATKFIVISGYSEFEYAQKALNFGASGYLLKPVSPEQLEAQVRKALSETYAAIGKSKTLEIGEPRGKQNPARQLEQEAYRLLSMRGPFGSANDTPEPNMLGRLMNGQYALALLHIDKSSSYCDNKFRAMDGLRINIKEKIAAEACNTELYVFDNLKNFQEIFVLVPDCSPRTNILNRIFSKIRKETGFSFTTAVFMMETILNKQSYVAMRDALDMRFSKGNNRDFTSDKPGAASKVLISKETLTLLSLHIKKCDQENIKRTLEAIICTDKNVNTRLAYLGIINELVMECGRRKISIETLLAEGDITGEILDYMDSRDDIVSYLHSTIINTLRIEPMAPPNCKNIVEGVKKLVDENPVRSYSVKETAYQFAINPNYLSTLFKQLTGQGLIEYVNNRKIDVACRMLEESAASITQISESLGFEDVQYFFKLFRKVKGITPLEHKKQYKK